MRREIQIKSAACFGSLSQRFGCSLVGGEIRVAHRKDFFHLCLLLVSQGVQEPVGCHGRAQLEAIISPHPIRITWEQRPTPTSLLAGSCRE